MGWYSVKGVFRWYLKDTKETLTFEERIVLFQAYSFDHALDMAEIESIEYCEEDPKANFTIESLKIWRVYEISEKSVENGVEIFSSRSDSGMTSEQYIEKYYSSDDS